MKKLILLFVILTFSNLYSQSDNFIGTSTKTVMQNGVLNYQTVTNPIPNEGANLMVNEGYHDFRPTNNSFMRWSFTDAAAINNDGMVSGDGKTDAVGWYLNSKRVSVYGNINNTPMWEYQTPANNGRNYIAVSDTGDVIAAGSYFNIYLFNKTSSTPFFNLNLQTTIDTGTAGPLDLTSNGSYLLASANRNDTSWIYCFNKNSTVSTWKVRVPGQIQGIKIAGNDTLAIVNTYSAYYVYNIYTGVLRYSAPIVGGTQTSQGISGNGNIIAIINYQGWVRTYQWNGSTYNLLWQYQEPPGTYYNWVASVDITNDGQYVAIGTLIFLSSSTYDGTVRFFKVSSGNTPLWSYPALGDEVNMVSFSKNGKYLAAASWGKLDNSKDDIYVFRCDPGTGAPWYSFNSPGSAFMCSISNDGSSVIAGGKAVHARNFGSGGTLYNIFIDTTLNPLSVGTIGSETPKEYSLKQNYPNPFNPNTNFRFSILNEGLTKLIVYDIMGREVRTLVNERLQPGIYETTFDGSSLNSGVYFYKLDVNGFSQTRRMVMTK
jgi:Secretion system C-terminal sorting domain